MGNNELGRETAAERKWLQPLFRKVSRDGAEVTWSGRLFQKETIRWAVLTSIH